VKHRVRLTRTIERRCGEAVEAMIGKFEPWVLPRHEQARLLAKIGKGPGDWTEFDGFRTRSDDKRNTGLAQLSP
jgi:hypothetical protein